ncbi:DUF1801 domain-containing protein [Blastococcus sp. CT_GayMR16]|uniref:iron chaperone n=1 Tax=Blastococcus sp. CT_GayMR16 TaxID=2559607 RepID=UPI00107462F8|nr:DUF1801 domain-containing protein [Blastococcus sp. CT_GayMR16]TFV90340.1 hypothetical protein E4P38_02550 [Blastococcus sp. CT_GayMR16]
MATTFADVDEYIAALPEDVRPLLEGIRRSVRTVVPDVGETISYAMPTFLLDGQPLLHVAAWKKHIGVYPLPAMDDDLARDVEPFRGAKDTMRLPLDAVPYELFERVLAAMLQQRRAGVG